MLQFSAMIQAKGARKPTRARKSKTGRVETDRTHKGPQTGLPAGLPASVSCLNTTERAPPDYPQTIDILDGRRQASTN